MKVIGEGVLIKEVAIKRKSQLITGGADVDLKSTHIITRTVEQIGSKIDNPEIKIGDIPIFSEFTSFGNVKVISKTEQKIETLIIVHYNDIIGVDNVEEEEIVEEK